MPVGDSFLLLALGVIPLSVLEVVKAVQNMQRQKGLNSDSKVLAMTTTVKSKSMKRR